LNTLRIIARHRVAFAAVLAMVDVGVKGSELSSIEEVSVITTRIEQPLSDLPANVSVLDRSRLQSTSAEHIQQALSQVPGVSMHRGNGQESLPAIRSAVLTGAGACGHVLVLEDGIPVRGAGLCNVNELFDTHFDLAERIEVVRGANTAFYGSNALNGSVNVVLPSAGQDVVALEVGDNGYARIRTAVGYGEQQQTHGRVYLSVAENNGYRDDSGYDQFKFSWRHRLNLAEWELTAGATVARLDQETAGFIIGRDSYLDRGLSRQNLNPEAFRKSNTFRAWLKAERDVLENMRLVSSVYFRDTDMDFLQHFLPGDPLEQNAQRGFGWQSALYASTSDTISWAIGLDGEVSDGELRQSQSLPTPGSAFLTETIPTGIHYDYQVDTEQIGLFGQLDWQFTDEWRLLIGARWETMRYDYDNLARDGRTRDDGSECGFGGCRYSRPADREDRFTHVSPKLELRYTPNDTWRFTVAAADAFRAPQATELYRLQRAQRVADLDIVQAKSAEVSARYINDSLSWSASLYQIDSDNLIIRDSNFFNVDGQKTRSRGLELDMSHTVNERWSWRLLANFADHVYASDRSVDDVNIRGNQVDTAPRRFGSLFVNWQANTKLGLEAEWQHIGRYYLEPANLSDYPGHSLLHLRASYSLDDWRINLRLLNAANKRYAERADFSSFTEERYFPGEPRSLFAEVRYTF